MPVVSDAGPLIHLAQISKLYLLKKLFKQVTITPSVKWEAVNEGVKLGHSDAQVTAKAIMEGWIMVEEFPKRLASASKRLAAYSTITQTPIPEFPNLFSLMLIMALSGAWLCLAKKTSFTSEK